MFALSSSRWRRQIRRSRRCLGLAAAHRDHGGIVAGGVFLELGDIVDDIEAGILPEMALNKTDVMDPKCKIEFHVLNPVD